MADATRCALCGGPNDCGMALGKSDCWCFSTPIPAEVLARVPDEERNRVCVCRRCAESAGPRETASGLAIHDGGASRRCREGIMPPRVSARSVCMN